MSRPLLGPWRTRCQWTVTSTLLLLPFLRVHGDSLVRIDTPSRSLVLWGRPHPVEQMFLLLLLSLSLVFLFLLVTAVFGRLWCGWACPQTTLTDLTDALGRRLGRLPRALRTPAFHLACLALGLLVGANLTWYFLPPRTFFTLLAAGALPAPAVLATGLVGLALYADLAFVRRTLCRSLCPYGRFQAALADAATMTLQLAPDVDERCLECGACRRACPTGIDVRLGGQGEQVECIACGRCVDACTRIFAKKGEPGLVGYRFGRDNRLSSLVNWRTGLLLFASLASAAALSFASARWQPVTLSVRRSAAAARPLADGTTVHFFTAWAANRGRIPLVLALEATAAGAPASVRGRVTQLHLAPGQRLQVDAAVVLPPSPTGTAVPLVFSLVEPGGTHVAEGRAAVP